MAQHRSTDVVARRRAKGRWTARRAGRPVAPINGRRARLPRRADVSIVRDVHRAAPPRDDTASVVVVTHGDGRNISALITRLLAESAVDEIIVVASACTDDTVARALEAADSSERVRIYVEPERTGKDRAINFGLSVARCEFIVLVSGDVLPDAGAVTRLVRAVQQPGVGIAGGRPVPVNDPDTFMGHVAHLLWNLHHRLAGRQAKVGEVAAVRREAVSELPATSVDEACLQAMIESERWRAEYVPDAIIRNRAPGTARDLVRQRRRIHTGHLALSNRHGYVVPSLKVHILLSEFLAHLRERPALRSSRPLLWTSGAALLEGCARLLARIDHALGREHLVWDMVATAKDPAVGSRDDKSATG